MTPRRRTATGLLRTAAFAAALPALFVVGSQVAASASPTPDTGFSPPFSGVPAAEHIAPTEIANVGQVNEALGQEKADKIARELGLKKDLTFTRRQYLEFISGQGKGGEKTPAELVDASVKILTNTVDHPLYSNVNGHVTKSVLASYGVFVTPSGVLESPANDDAATRKVNAVIAPGGYMNSWCLQNGCIKSLQQLYLSPYTPEAVYGNQAQMQSEKAELVTNTKGSTSAVVGMSMAPALWIVNFELIYTLNPELAANMPARWAPLPATVAQAIAANPDGQVPYADYEADFG
jgi:hypothetical protein